jgi:hypothetical protein
MKKEQTWELRLYVAGKTPKSSNSSCEPEKIL